MGVAETSVLSVPNCLINRKPPEKVHVFGYGNYKTEHQNKEGSGDARTCDVAKAVDVPTVTPTGSQCTRECESSDATSAGSRVHLAGTLKDIQDKSVVWPICMSVYFFFFFICTFPVAGRWMFLSPHGPYVHLKGMEQGKQRHSHHCRVWGLNLRAEAEPGQGVLLQRDISQSSAFLRPGWQWFLSFSPRFSTLQTPWTVKQKQPRQTGICSLHIKLKSNQGNRSLLRGSKRWHKAQKKAKKRRSFAIPHSNAVSGPGDPGGGFSA